MAKHIIAFGTSTSSTSINQQLAIYAGNFFENVEVKILDLRNYQCQIYSTDEEALDFPDVIKQFYAELKAADGILISLAEHNFSFTAAYKNTFDWFTRYNIAQGTKVLKDKPIAMLSMSPSPKGGSKVLQAALDIYNFFGANIIDSLSIPRSYENFVGGRCTNEELNQKIQSIVKKLEEIVIKSTDYHN